MPLKDYFNKDERIDMLFLKKYIDNCEKVIETWDKRGNLTKEERKCLRTGLTWGLKAFNSITDRQSDQTVKTFYNSLKDAYINIQDAFAVKLYNKKLSSNMTDCYEQNRDYYALVENIMDKCCKNCTQNHNDCPFAAEFEAHCIPEPTGDTCGNCRYAFKEFELHKTADKSNRSSLKEKIQKKRSLS